MATFDGGEVYLTYMSPPANAPDDVL